MTAKSLSQGRTVPPYDYEYSSRLPSLPFFTHSQVQLFRPPRAGPPQRGPPNIYVTAKSAWALIERRGRLLSCSFRLRILEIFVPQITAKADQEVPKLSGCNAPSETRLSFECVSCKGLEKVRL